MTVQFSLHTASQKDHACLQKLVACFGMLMQLVMQRPCMQPQLITVHRVLEGLAPDGACIQCKGVVAIVHSAAVWSLLEVMRVHTCYLFQ